MMSVVRHRQWGQLKTRPPALAKTLFGNSREQPQQPSEKFCVFAAFDLGPQPPHDPELCRLYQFGQYHDWTKCKRKAGHVCCFCRSRGMPAGSHGCFKCPRGGKLQITKFKKENGLY